MPRTIASFKHPKNGVTFTNAYLRIGPFSVDPNQLIANVRCDVFPSEAAYNAARGADGKIDVRAAIWDGSFQITGQEFIDGMTEVQSGEQLIDEVFYEHAATKLIAEQAAFVGGKRVLVISGTELP